MLGHPIKRLVYISNSHIYYLTIGNWLKAEGMILLTLASVVACLIDANLSPQFVDAAAQEA